MTQFDIAWEVGAFDAPTTSTTTTFTLPHASTANVFVVFEGTGFTYDGQGRPTAGTITSVSLVVVADVGGGPLATITNLAIDLGDVGDLLTDFFTTRALITWLGVVTADAEPAIISPTQIRLVNSDGTFTDIIGTGFDVSAPGALAGNVTSVRHIDDDGTSILSNVAIAESLNLVVSSLYEINASDTLWMLVNTGNNTLTFNGAVNAGPDSYTIGLLDGPGNDTIVSNFVGAFVQFEYASSGVTVDIGAGTATGGGGSNTLNSNITGAAGSNFNDTLTGDGQSNYFDGRDGDDTIQGGDGDDDLDGGAGADTINGGNGNDWLFFDEDDLISPDPFTPVGSVTVDLNLAGAQSTGAGLDTLTSIENVRGASGSDVLTGNSAANTLIGFGGFDTLNGGGGADTLDGGDDDDNLTGGLGVDSINGGDGDDTINWAPGDGVDATDGGAGTDLLMITGVAVNDNVTLVWNGSSFTSFSGGALTSVEQGFVNLGAGLFDTLRYTGSTVGVNIDLAIGGSTGLIFLAGVEHAYGSALADVLTGSADDNTLYGDAGNDTITGNDGADTITGAGGVDTINAGNGDDIIVYNFGDGVDSGIQGGAGTDRITCVGNAGGETLDAHWNGTSFTAFKGTTVTSIEQATFNGGGGVDWLRMFNSTVAVSIDLIAGTATGFLALSNVENLWGSQQNDTLNGSNLANTIRGSGGDDVINGAADNDVLIGDDGVDTLNGGDDQDSLYGLAGADIVNGGNGNDTIYNNFGEGVDVIDGGAGTDTIICVGNSGAETLEVVWDGSAFTFFKGGAVTSIELAQADMGVGGDWLRYTGNTVGVAISLVGGTADGFTSIANIENAAGGAGADQITGTDAANNLIGNGGNDFITGLGGNDTLNGGAGIDQLVGGTGSDNLIGGADSDTFMFAAGSGVDNIADFDANATGGQDFLDISGYGITAGTFGARVTITDLGVNTLVTIDGTNTIFLSGVTGDGNNVITQADFILA